MNFGTLSDSHCCVFSALVKGAIFCSGKQWTIINIILVSSWLSFTLCSTKLRDSHSMADNAPCLGVPTQNLTSPSHDKTLSFCMFIFYSTSTIKKRRILGFLSLFFTVLESSICFIICLNENIFISLQKTAIIGSIWQICFICQVL